MLTFEITIGKGDKQQTRRINFDPEEITLGFLEDMEAAQESKKWSDLNRAIAGMLDLSRDEVRALTQKQFKEIGAAIQEAAKEANDAPNA